MNKKFDFNVLDSMTVKSETLKGLAVEFNPLQADGVTLAVLSDLNKVSIDVYLKRNGGDTEYIFNGYLEDYLLGLYSQTPLLELYKTARGLTYKMFLDFGGILALRGNDQLVVKMRAQNTAFTSLSTAQSSFNVETVPALGPDTPLTVVEGMGIPAGETNVNMILGDNVFRAVAVTDRSNDYFASNAAKFDGVEISGEDFVKNVSKSLLEIENISYLRNNPETVIEDLVLYWEDEPLMGGRLQGKLTQSADPDSKVMVVRRQWM
ncbi:hypothetical protein [Flagellimonas algicola]|uniref:Viral coat protein P2 N-terminal domain-containing protein n=1 Tax=Flagellimonas algicola TaxID=2583815 RepID=A0ABY2WNZ9_9FLAO|nr:hypothetical protein [Allomuricauda algicola]TMU56480.1 hypothetical protein FGG15_02775 [Allomuricauda algicola]